MTKLTKKQRKAYVAMALVVGANELAARAKTLGDAIWWRATRAEFVREALKHGVTFDNADELQTIRVDAPTPTADEALMLAAGAAEERARVVAYLQESSAFFATMPDPYRDACAVLKGVARQVELLDHHREREGA